MKKNDPYYDTEIISLWELFAVIWAGKVKVFAITAVFALASVMYALSIADQYKATTLLVPVQSSTDGLSGALGRLGGLASLAGVNIGDSGGVSEVKIAQEIMVSRNFIENFIEKNNLAFELAAIKEWDKETQSLLINNEIYDVENKKWVVENGRPSSWSLFKTFSGMIEIKNTESGLTSVSISSLSPQLAKRFLDLYIAAINAHMGERRVAKATININYLEAQIEKAATVTTQSAIFSIIEEQLKSKMLAEASPNYVFDPINPIMAPEKKFAPNRALICITVTLMGVMLSILFLL